MAPHDHSGGCTDQWLRRPMAAPANGAPTDGALTKVRSREHQFARQRSSIAGTPDV